MKKNIIIIMMIMIVGGVSVPKKTIVIDKARYMIGNQVDDTKKEIVRSIFDNNDLEINKIEIKNDEDLNKYMEQVLNEIENILSKENITKDDKDILNKTFVDIADFIFYDKEIKGYKFKDLSLTTKKNILGLFKNLDIKIEEKYPDYKNNLEIISKNSYSNIKEKINDLLKEYKSQLKVETYKSCKKESNGFFSKLNRWINNWIKKVSD